MSDDSAESAPRPRGVFVPILLLALAVVVSLAVQLAFLIDERGKLAAASTSLGAQEVAADKIRASLDTLASATARLAAAGNPGARAIVEQLRGRGITINAPASSAAR
jgi:hypothetical protein